MFFAMLLMFNVGVEAARIQPRKSTGYKWSDKYATVKFYCNVDESWKAPIKSAMATWNTVKEGSTGKIQRNLTEYDIASKKNIYW